MNLDEINELIATKVMGWYRHEESIYNGSASVWMDSDFVQHSFVEDFLPSDDIEDAWKVLNYVCKKHNWRAIIDRNQNQTEVNFKNQMGGDMQYYGIAETTPMAICLATLESVGVDVEAFQDESDNK